MLLRIECFVEILIEQKKKGPHYAECRALVLGILDAVLEAKDAEEEDAEAPEVDDSLPYTCASLVRHQVANDGAQAALGRLASAPAQR